MMWRCLHITEPDGEDGLSELINERNDELEDDDTDHEDGDDVDERWFRKVAPLFDHLHCAKKALQSWHDELHR